jgi:hypothetical protein
MLLLGDNLVKAGLWRSEENAGILRSAQNDKRKGNGRAEALPLG